MRHQIASYLRCIRVHRRFSIISLASWRPWRFNLNSQKVQQMAIGFGIIGAGMISRFHAKAIAEVKGAKLVACADTLARAGRGSRQGIRLHAVRLARRHARRPGGRRRDDRHPQRRPHGARRRRRQGRQARHRREAARDHAQALRQDHRRLREGRRQARHDLPVAVPRLGRS